LDNKSYFPFHIIPCEEHFLNKNSVALLLNLKLKGVHTCNPWVLKPYRLNLNMEKHSPSYMSRRVETPC